MGMDQSTGIHWWIVSSNPWH